MLDENDRANTAGDAMTDPMRLRQALLDLGLEDLIPLPEIAGADEIREILEPGRVAELATALVDLLHEGRIQVWSGHWSKDPEVVDPHTAEKLLGVEEQYEFNSSADLRLRLYYANVELFLTESSEGIDIANSS